MLYKTLKIKKNNRIYYKPSPTRKKKKERKKQVKSKNRRKRETHWKSKRNNATDRKVRQKLTVKIWRDSKKDTLREKKIIIRKVKIKRRPQGKRNKQEKRKGRRNKRERNMDREIQQAKNKI